MNVNRTSYPHPPAGLARDRFVDQMLDRYRMLAEQRTTLGDAANFCLTVLELSAGNRRKAATRYAIALTVLNNLAVLSAKKGANEARKAEGASAAFTADESTWLREVLKAIIRRAAEIAYDPHGVRRQITMADLPST